MSKIFNRTLVDIKRRSPTGSFIYDCLKTLPTESTGKEGLEGLLF